MTLIAALPAARWAITAAALILAGLGCRIGAFGESSRLGRERSA